MFDWSLVASKKKFHEFAFSQRIHAELRYFLQKYSHLKVWNWWRMRSIEYSYWIAVEMLNQWDLLRELPPLHGGIFDKKMIL